MKFGTFFFILVFCLVFSDASGQLAKTIGVPIIRSYSGKDFNTETQIWAIAQDLRGVMYFGTNTGVLEYDGRYWRLLKTRNSSSVRSLAVDKNGRIYVGATREFGYLEPDSLGKMRYISISKQLSETRFESVWKIYCTEEGVYFVAGRQYIYKYVKPSLKLLPSNGTVSEMRAFGVNNQIFVSDINAGIGKIVNDTIKFFNAGIDVSAKVIYSILPLKENQFLLGTRKDGLFVFDAERARISIFKENVNLIKRKKGNRETSVNDPNISVFACNMNEYFKTAQIYSGSILNDGSLLINTLKGGSVILNTGGELINILNEKNGIHDNSVYSSFQEKNGDLWLGMEKGICHVELSSPFTVFDASNGLEGTIQTSYIFKNNLFVGTSNGIFSLENSNKPTTMSASLYSFIPITTNHLFNLDFLSVYNRDKSRNILLASSLREILHIDNQNIKEIKTVYGCYNLCLSNRIPGRVFLGHSNGICALKVNFIENGGVYFQDEGDLSNIKENTRNLIADSRGDIWYATAFNGVGYIRFNDDEDLSVFDSYKFDTASGLPEMSNNFISFHNGKIILTTSKGIYRLSIPPGFENNPMAFKFIRDNSFGLNFSVDSVSVARAFVDNRQNVWMITSSGLMKYDIMTDQLVSAPFKRIKDEKIDRINIDNQGNGWFTGASKIFRYDARKQMEMNANIQTLIRRVVMGKDSTIYYGTSLDTVPLNFPELINYKNNSIIFEFALPSFYNENKNQFSYYLDGFDDGWRNWDIEAKAVYTNLPAGKYIFRVKSMDIFNNSGKEAQFVFQIDSPWYLTIYAISIYIIIAFLLVYFLIRLNINRLKLEKERLEEIIKAAIEKVEQQKEELRVQAERLVQTNVELEKLSIVARETDNAVVIMDPKGNYEWINEGFTRIYGYTLDQLIEDRNRNFIGISSTLNIKDLVNIWFGNKKPIIYEAMTNTKDGRKIWAQTTLTPILDENGKLIRLIAIDTDITKVKNAEAEIQKQRDEIQRQRDIALQQRDEISAQKKEIMDSIHYAKRIQKAILPTEKILKAYFPDSFVLNLPRDIVSGDFFWVVEKQSKIFIAAADCTGHGVPGALMSMIGITFLNETVIDKGIVNADEILNTLRQNIISSLKQSSEDSETQDGMDISLCVVDKKSRIVEFAGANQYMIHIHNGEINDIKPDKMPISIGGRSDVSFSQKSIYAGENDAFYLFTDGYIDQFGGGSEKKFKFSNFKNLIRSIYQVEMNKQQIILMDELEKWKGDLPQVDDILVVGFKF